MKMASLLLEVHFWTHSEDVIVHPDDVGAYKFHDKTESSSVMSTHQKIKESYASSRGITTRLTNKRRSRDRDSFKQLEELLDTQKLCYQSWHHLNLLLLVFESGTVVTLWVNFQTGNIDKLLIDKTLLGKMGSDQVVSAALTDQFLLLTHPENRVTLVSLQRPLIWERWARLSTLEPRATVWELPGPTTRRTERRLALPQPLQQLQPPPGGQGPQRQQVAVWWSAAVGEIQPWTPTGRDQDRANVLVYGVTPGPAAPPAEPGQIPPDGARLELLSYCKTHHDPLLVQFSHLRPDTLYTVEQNLTKTGEVLVEHGTYDVSSAVCQQLSAITIPLTAEVLCAALSPDERRLLLGCADNSLLLHNCARQMTHMVKIQMTPCRAAWHQHSTVAFVTSETGQLRGYDLALSQVPIQLLGHGCWSAGGAAPAAAPNAAPTQPPAPAAAQAQSGLGLGQYFRFKPRVCRLLHCPEVMSQQGHVLQSLLITFVRGPMALLCLQVSRPNKGRVYPSDVISDYVSGQRLDAAINLLTSLNWEQQGDEALAGLYMIVNQLLKLPLTPAREAQLEAALGSYLAPVRALSPPVENMYGDRIRNITRRFFHHLLRHRCYEKAYRLALDLRDHDLFMDLHRAALRSGERHLAAAALTKADEMDNASSSATSGSECGETSSCSSDCSSSWHSDGDQSDDLLIGGDGEGALTAQLRAARLAQPAPGQRANAGGEDPAAGRADTQAPERPAGPPPVSARREPAGDGERPTVPLLTAGQGEVERSGALQLTAGQGEVERSGVPLLTPGHGEVGRPGFSLLTSGHGEVERPGFPLLTSAHQEPAEVEKPTAPLMSVGHQGSGEVEKPKAPLIRFGRQGSTQFERPTGPLATFGRQGSAKAGREAADHLDIRPQGPVGTEKGPTGPLLASVHQGSTGDGEGPADPPLPFAAQRTREAEVAAAAWSSVSQPRPAEGGAERLPHPRPSLSAQRSLEPERPPLPPRPAGRQASLGAEKPPLPPRPAGLPRPRGAAGLSQPQRAAAAPQPTPGHGRLWESAPSSAHQSRERLWNAPAPASLPGQSQERLWESAPASHPVQSQERLWESAPVSHTVQSQERLWESAPRPPHPDQSQERLWESAPVSHTVQSQERLWESAPRPPHPDQSQERPWQSAPSPAAEIGPSQARPSAPQPLPRSRPPEPEDDAALVIHFV